MFDRDKEYGTNLAGTFADGEPFVLLGAKMADRTIDTAFGEADVAELLVQRVGPDGFARGNEITCTTVASAIVAKVREADDGDFPALVELRHVPSKKNRGVSALVLQFLSPYYPGDATVVTSDGDTRRVAP